MRVRHLQVYLFSSLTGNIHLSCDLGGIISFGRSLGLLLRWGGSEEPDGIHEALVHRLQGKST